MSQKLDLSSALNKIRATSSNAYQSAVPIATANNIKDVGVAVCTALPVVRNEFMSGIYNKIGLTLIDTPIIENEYAHLKKGVLENGQTIEDIYLGIATADTYVTGMKEGDSAPDQFSIKKLPAQSAFYSYILTRQYQVTRHLTELRKAFHNGQTLAEFVAGFMQAMISGENWDDMKATIALIARQIEASQEDSEGNKFKGTVHLISGFNATVGEEDEVTADDCMHSQKFLKYFANQLKKYSKRLRHPRTDLNIAGVLQTLPQSRQRIMMIEDITVDFETELMAWAYNADKFVLNGIDEIECWYSIGADGQTTPEVSPEDLKIKSTFKTSEGGSAQCVALIYDEGMAKIYNKERIASQADNAKGNYWNMFMSLEDIYACSPYRNFVCFMLD